jgi:tetratricopeptide (TPR) repeat protein
LTSSERLTTLDFATMNTARFWKLTQIAFCCFLMLYQATARAADTNNISAAAVATNAAEIAASNDTLRAYLQLQEQLHETQLSLDRVRKESQLSAQKTADALSTQLNAMQQTLSSQRARDTHFTLVLLSIFAGLCFVAVVLTSFFQWRAVNRFADFSSTLSNHRSLGAPPTMAALGLAESQMSISTEPSGGRLLGAIDRLEKRILELEHTTKPALENPDVENTSNKTLEENGQLVLDTSAPENIIHPDESAPAKSLLEKGQTLLNSNNAEAAMECFDEALALNSADTEALVKKGAALEKLRKFPEAIECYDRAIAVDGSMTIAYLYKGGVYNRMEKFAEAVECYEQALRTQEKRTAA